MTVNEMIDRLNYFKGLGIGDAPIRYYTGQLTEEHDLEFFTVNCATAHIQMNNDTEPSHVTLWDKQSHFLCLC